MKASTKAYTKGFVASADCTRIGYRQLGSGPGVVLLHGGVNASQHLMRLGRALAGTFTVCIPDRRGRGLSGPIGADYSLRTEDEDLAALLEQTGARNVFGVADGALFALHGALSLPNIEKVAAYEPLLFLDQPGLNNFLGLCSSSTSSWPRAGWAMPSSPRSRVQVRRNHGLGSLGLCWRRS
ncbi:MAG TPA: alpha/beta hydrolase [Propionibacteriaceae bacterium]|jgi:pimeloyl-ACP methyl ester carboxylesterase|nr:alpha/beta hydrolase [Propionibacteriaceae bacterium]